MPDIILTTLNARYIHTALGLRYLYTNLGDLHHRAAIKEFTINDRTVDIVEQLLACQPKIIGIGVYIWNALEVEHLIKILKAVAPKSLLVLGGPEVSHQPYRIDTSAADYIIQGEGEAAFFRLCSALLQGVTPPGRIISSPPADPAALQLPYTAYTDKDIQHRVAYVEASRGCPFSCEFCLSSQEKSVRCFAMEPFLHELEILWKRGARNFKFIDRTFNIQGETTCRILDFFLHKSPPFLAHFEVMPEYFPDYLKQRLQGFAPGTLQLEIGIQTLNPEISAAINRQLHLDKIKENLAFLEQETNAHLHVDLIIGLPGETREQFARNLNLLTELTNAEIQLGILKKLSGTTINRHDTAHGMIYSPLPPYEILANDALDFPAMQELKRFARFWDLLYNSGNFQQSVRLLWAETDTFSGFMGFSTWLYQETGTTWQISLKRLAELLFTYLVQQKGCSEPLAAEVIATDLNRVPGRTSPPLLRQHLPKTFTSTPKSRAAGFGKRQARHLG